MAFLHEHTSAFDDIGAIYVHSNSQQFMCNFKSPVLKSGNPTLTWLWFYPFSGVCCREL